MNLNKTHFHFIGIGGIGMCGLAELLQVMGAQVSGSDLRSNSKTARLEKLGVKFYVGHAAANLDHPDVVVYSSAVPATNVEVVEARKLQIPLIARAEALAEIMRLKRGIAVAGTHGKTTTTSLVASIFLKAEQSPTIVVGGKLQQIQSTAVLGQGEWLIAEADESDGSFQKLSPEIAIITNIDSDHLDFFKTFENLEKAFFSFASRIPFYGRVIACGDDPLVRKLFSDFPKKIETYGFEKENDWVLKGEKGTYEISHKESSQKYSLQLALPGKHNALNSAAAFLTALAAGIDPGIVVEALKEFSGVERRFQFKGEAKNIKIYDDYGHHPTEVRATLNAFKEKFPENRLVVYFQPHRYSRTQICWDEFLDSFADADKLLLTDIYPAGEKPIESISSEILLKAIEHKEKLFIEKTVATSRIISLLKAGDVFLTLGAGDGWKIGQEILDLLNSEK